MAIYVRNKQGDMEALKIQAINGRDGVTPNITVGTVTTLEPDQQATVENVGTLENPIFNFGIPKGKDGEGSGNASIDDTTISTETTWSSSKIEDFVLTNDDTIWADVSGENLSIDYTKEGYLREVEIWGNTIQNEEDLSDIQHLGELYVNELGEPILDDLGREQYKIEIESCNANLLQNTQLECGYGGNINPSDTKYRQFLFVPKTIGNYILATEKNEINIAGAKYVGSSTTIKMETINANNIRRFIVTELNPIWFHMRREDNAVWSFGTDTDSINLKISIDNSIDSNLMPKSHKTTILLPCQLCKVGDVSDRLYWDSEKGKYVVEKNIGNFPINNIKITANPTVGVNNARIDLITKTSIGIVGTIGGNDNAIARGLKKTSYYVSDKDAVELQYSFNADAGGEWIGIVLPSRFNTNTLFIDELKRINLEFYIKLKTPQLIETTILEEIKIPTYIDKTHLFINGGIDGTIKAKVPLDGGTAILSLSEENELLQLESQEITETNENQDKLIDITLCATDEIFMMLEPLLSVETLSTVSTISDRLVNMYVVMIQRGLKSLDDVNERYRDKVREVIECQSM